MFKLFKHRKLENFFKIKFVSKEAEIGSPFLSCSSLELLENHWPQSVSGHADPRILNFEFTFCFHLFSYVTILDSLKNLHILSTICIMTSPSPLTLHGAFFIQ